MVCAPLGLPVLEALVLDIAGLLGGEGNVDLNGGAVCAVCLMEHLGPVLSVFRDGNSVFGAALVEVYLDEIDFLGPA